MDKYSRYYGVLILGLIVIVSLWFSINNAQTMFNNRNDSIGELDRVRQELQTQQNKVRTIEAKLKKLKDSSSNVSKKIYAPSDSGLGDDSLFFTLYTDVIEMVHSNSVRIKSMDYKYNPSDDPFVQSGGGSYFVSDINMSLVSNYVNLGKLIQDIYQYPYYIKINSVDIKPYEKDKTILLSNISLRLYSKTVPDEE